MSLILWQRVYYPNLYKMYNIKKKNIEYDLKHFKSNTRLIRIYKFQIWYCRIKRWGGIQIFDHGAIIILHCRWAIPLGGVLLVVGPELPSIFSCHSMNNNNSLWYPLPSYGRNQLSNVNRASMLKLPNSPDVWSPQQKGWSGIFGILKKKVSKYVVREDLYLWHMNPWLMI